MIYFVCASLMMRKLGIHVPCRHGSLLTSKLNCLCLDFGGPRWRITCFIDSSFLFCGQSISSYPPRPPGEGLGVRVFSTYPQLLSKISKSLVETVQLSSRSAGQAAHVSHVPHELSNISRSTVLIWQSLFKSPGKPAIGVRSTATTSLSALTAPAAICPLSLIPLAERISRFSEGGTRSLRSVNTSIFQRKAREPGVPDPPITIGALSISSAVDVVNPGSGSIRNASLATNANARHTYAPNSGSKNQHKQFNLDVKRDPCLQGTWIPSLRIIKDAQTK